MMDFYYLNEKGQHVKTSIEDFGKTGIDPFNDPRRHVKRVKLICKKTGLEGTLSTVFLCLDHAIFPYPNHKPILWESMIFISGHTIDEYQWRHTSKKKALRLHRKLQKAFRNGHVFSLFGIKPDLKELED